MHINARLNQVREIKTHNKPEQRVCESFGFGHAYVAAKMDAPVSPSVGWQGQGSGLIRVRQLLFCLTRSSCPCREAEI